MTTEQIHTSAWLNRAFLSKVKLNSLITQRDTLRTLAERVTIAQSGNDASTSINANNGTENALIELADISAIIETEIKSLIQVYNEVNNAIGKVEDETLQALLRYRYLSFMPMAKIAEAMYCDLSTIKRKHKQALDKVEPI